MSKLCQPRWRKPRWWRRQRLFPPCLAAMLTFLSATSTDATEKPRPIAPPCPDPLQLRQHKVPILTDETKCRNCSSHMTPLYSENQLRHKQAGQTDTIYPIKTQCTLAFPKQSPKRRKCPVCGTNSSCFSCENWRPFCESLRRKKEGRLRSFKK